MFVVIFCIVLLIIGAIKLLKLAGNPWQDESWHSQLFHTVRTMSLAFCLMLVMLVTTACGTLKPNAYNMHISHTSHPTVGFPVTSVKDTSGNFREDSLDVANACLERDGEWFYEACAGIKLRDGGFFGPPLVTSFRFGKRWRME